jgi:hypothetical protein
VVVIASVQGNRIWILLVASKSKNIKPDHERDERAEQFALCSLLFELKFPNAIALSFGTQLEL